MMALLADCVPHLACFHVGGPVSPTLLKNVQVTQHLHDFIAQHPLLLEALIFKRLKMYFFLLFPFSCAFFKFVFL